MLVFPGLGSQIEESKNRSGGSECPLEQHTLSGNQKEVNIFLRPGYMVSTKTGICVEGGLLAPELLDCSSA